SVDPGDAATHLFRHDAEITASLLYWNEVKRNVVRAGIDNHFGWKCVILGLSTKPSPTVNEYKDRCFGTFRSINVELLKSRRAIRFAHWLPDATADRLAGGAQALDDFQPQGRIEGLVIGCVEFHLVHIHPNERTLLVGWRPNPALLRECGCCNHRSGTTESRTPSELLAKRRDLNRHDLPPSRVLRPQQPHGVQDSSFLCPRNVKRGLTAKVRRTILTQSIAGKTILRVVLWTANPEPAASKTSPSK